MGHALLKTEPYVSPEAYLAAEEQAERKHEYADGRVIAMAGAGEAHGQITGNLVTELNNRLRKRGCRVISSDLRVKAGRSYRYPDVAAYCHEGAFSDGNPPSLLNPELLVEVISPSTSETDRRDKLAEYMDLESVQEYWVAEQDQPFVTQHLRREASWVTRIVRGLGEMIRSEHFGIEIPLADVYALVERTEPPEPGDPGRTSEASGDGA